MTEDQKKVAIRLGVIAAGLLLIGYLANRGKVAAVPPAADSGADFMSPYFAPNAAALAGGSPGFQSVVNVNVDPVNLGILSEQYVPLFGFIASDLSGGIGTTSINTTINYTAAQLAQMMPRNSAGSGEVVRAWGAGADRAPNTVRSPSLEALGYVS